MHTFPDLIKKIRNEANLTQEGFASALGVSTVLISMIETGQKPPSKKFIQIISNKLDVHPSSITPFVYIGNNVEYKKLSSPEKALLKVGETLQNYLITVKAKKLK